MKIRVGKYLIQIPDKIDYCNSLSLDPRTNRCLIEYIKLIIFSYDYVCRVYLTRKCRAHELLSYDGLNFISEYLPVAIRELNNSIRSNGYEKVLIQYINYFSVNYRN
jgi:hypothetical protein